MSIGCVIRIIKILLGLSLLIGPHNLYASSKNTKDNEALNNKCFEILSDNVGPIEVHSDGDRLYADKLKKDAEIIAQVASKLGLETPRHQLNIVPSAQINTLVNQVGHAAPHWKPGHDLTSNPMAGIGVLEYVTKGCPSCRAYYSGSTPHTEQLSVVMHVHGHNDMSMTSVYQTIRETDSQLASYHLAQKLGEFYNRYGHDEVSLFYQLLLSLAELQDFSFGTYEAPEQLAKGLKSSPHVGKPWSKTASVLQALTLMLPPQAPDWQRELIALFEQKNRAFPAVFQTKIMNEGWATLMQFILAKHLPWTQSSDLVTFAQLVSGAVSPSFENPYWLGLSGWWNLYEEFLLTDSIQHLSSFDKDAAFIAWARKMYAGKNDDEWARVAFNQRWVEKQRLYLYRPILQAEIDKSRPSTEQTHIALTRNWKRIQNYVINKFIHKKMEALPSFSIKNRENSMEPIVLNQELQDMRIPIDIASAAKTIFVISKIFKSPVELRGLFPTTKVDEKDSDKTTIGPPKLGALTIDSEGLIRFASESASASELVQPTSIARNAAQEYAKDLLTDLHSEAPTPNTTFVSALQKISDSMSGTSMETVDYAPHTGAAIREYLQFVEARLSQTMKNAIAGDSNIKFGKNGVRLAALPEIPKFSFSKPYLKKRWSELPLAPVDEFGKNNNLPFHVDANRTSIASGPYVAGDRFKAPAEQNSQSSGEGDSDGEEGDDGDGKSSGKPSSGKPGKEGKDDQPGQSQGGNNPHPQEINIPLELYGELLAEMLELPNIKRTKGSMHETQTIRRGKVRKPSGNKLWDEIMIGAIEKARAIRKGQGRPYDNSVPLRELINEALPLIEPSDIVVSGKMEKPLPLFDAVIIVNMDMTGSMNPNRIKMAKNLIYNLKALLAAKYKSVKFHFVGFSEQASEYSEEEIYKTHLGGGTNYASAAELDKTILSRYSDSQYNKYIVTLGDCETSTADAKLFVDHFDDIKDSLQYVSTVITNETVNGAQAYIVSEHERMAQTWPWIRVTRMQKQQDIFRVISDMFKTETE